MTDLTLTGPLSGCASGLVVGADDITIDLNGYSIEGTGAEGSAGIAAADRAHVLVKNGTVTGFGTGVSMLGTSESIVRDLRISATDTGVVVSNGVSNQVVANTISNGRVGIYAGFSTLTRVIRNVVTGSSHSGIFCEFHFEGFPAYFEANTVTRNGSGFVLGFCAAVLRRNIASHNSGYGIRSSQSTSTLEKNVANQNGATGIDATDSHGLYSENVTNGNARHGLRLFDAEATHGPLHTISGHVAMTNGFLGISLEHLDGVLAGVIDGGKNRARSNGDPRQCFGISCN
jgi:nitrous oxidase accessory protein NosD